MLTRKDALDTKRQLPISIIMGDINGLKLINDGFGHQKGDELLKKIANVIKGCCREEDIIARWGGDAFVNILPQTSAKDAEKIITRIKEKCNNAENKLVKPSIALGYATKTRFEEDIEEIVKKADNWAYNRKLLES